jgi:transposase
MKQKSGSGKAPAEQVLKDILEGLRGEENISELCRREGIAANAS